MYVFTRAERSMFHFLKGNNNDHDSTFKGQRIKFLYTTLLPLPIFTAPNCFILSLRYSRLNKVVDYDRTMSYIQADFCVPLYCRLWEAESFCQLKQTPGFSVTVLEMFFMVVSICFGQHVFLIVDHISIMMVPLTLEEPSCMLILEQGSTNSCKGPDSNYFGLYGLCHNSSTLLFQQENSHREWNMVQWLYCHFIYSTEI